MVPDKTPDRWQKNAGTLSSSSSFRVPVKRVGDPVADVCFYHDDEKEEEKEADSCSRRKEGREEGGERQGTNAGRSVMSGIGKEEEDEMEVGGRKKWEAALE